MYHIFIVISRKLARHTERQTSLPPLPPPPPAAPLIEDEVHPYYIYYNYNIYIL